MSSKKLEHTGKKEKASVKLYEIPVVNSNHSPRRNLRHITIPNLLSETIGIRNTLSNHDPLQISLRTIFWIILRRGSRGCGCGCAWRRLSPTVEDRSGCHDNRRRCRSRLLLLLRLHYGCLGHCSCCIRRVHLTTSKH